MTAPPSDQPRWKRVEIVAAVGTEIGMVGDADGVLTLAVRRTGEPWPHGAAPVPESVSSIEEPCTRFRVWHDGKD